MEKVKATYNSRFSQLRNLLKPVVDFPLENLILVENMSLRRRHDRYATFINPAGKEIYSKIIMKIIFSLFLIFVFNTIHSQVVEDDWKKFELKSKWKVNYIQNDSIKENRPHLGELVFLNTNAKEPKFKVVFTVYKSEAELNSRYFETRKVLKSILLEKSPNVVEKFEFKNNFYLLSLSEELLFRDKFYNSLVKEIEKYIYK